MRYDTLSLATNRPPGPTRRQVLIGGAVLPLAVLVPFGGAAAATSTTAGSLTADSSLRIAEL